MEYLEKLEQTEARYEELTRQMADPSVIGDPEKYRATAKKQRELEEIVAKFREWKKVREDLAQARSMLHESDAGLRQMAADEVARLEPELARLEQEIKILLLPKDPNDEKNVVLEIRAGTGGDEATLFAAEVFRMYTRYAESQHWRVEVTSASESGVGGLKEVIALISGDKVYSRLKYESGVHRVQRVPVTEQQGRVHQAASRSTPPTRPCASRTCRPASWFPARTRNRRSRTAPRPSACSGRAFMSSSSKSSGPKSEPSAAAWSARVTAAKRSAPTTSRRIASRTTVSGSRSTSSIW
jgi:hypothetical protein